MKYCAHCGAEMMDEAQVCVKCGCAAKKPEEKKENKVSPKSRTIDLLLLLFVGGAGIHKFYEGKIGMGILYLFTGGLFGIGCIIDLINILTGKAKDNDGLEIVNWN